MRVEWDGNTLGRRGRPKMDVRTATITSKMELNHPMLLKDNVALLYM